MKAIHRFTVRAAVPPALSALEELAANLRWAWHQPTRDLFGTVSPRQWQDTGHDPIALLAAVSPERLAELAADPSFVERANRQRDDLNDYLGSARWYQSLPKDQAPQSIAYFSPEFGIAEALPQYSGGLGILAGDHLKSASDLGVPLVGVGLFYRAGYFSQAISADGWQQESYPELDPDGLPLSVLRRADGTAALVELAMPDDRILHARVWRTMVGRVPLLLLDADVPANDDDLRTVTDRLYGGGAEHRLQQELLLGIGGVRALKLWAEYTGQEKPCVFHTNEGHAGFLGLERICDLIAGGLTFSEALQVVRSGTVFTTHTPVAAGIDRFEVTLVERYVSDGLLPGVNLSDVLALGSEAIDGAPSGVFNMAIMGLRLGQRANGVSKLHGSVSRRMFSSLWPGFDPVEVPIGSVTNGVHAPTWTDPMLTALASEKLGAADTTLADWASDAVSDADLWSVRSRMREQLVTDARRRVTAAWHHANPGRVIPEWLGAVLDPGILTIGFARRVPTYKRLTLMLHDPERLRAILLNPQRPVQLVIAGKSHPADDEGKALIQKLVRFGQEPGLREHLVFLPDYDIGMAQILYPGTDVWLNNPLRPLEACGTSGMKAALNGSLNLSILDGWWDEYFDGENGWAIPSAGSSVGAAERDAIEATALYELIEHRIAPTFYERDENGIPRRWLHSIRHTLATLSGELSADRMVRQYVQELYLPAAEFERRMTADDYAAARELAKWKARVSTAWPGVRVLEVQLTGADAAPEVGDTLSATARVKLNGLDPDDVSVDVVFGVSRDGNELADARMRHLYPASTGAGEADGVAEVFSGELVLKRAGSIGYTVRVVPRNDLLASPAEMGLVAVAE
ncbi:MAG: alpha-glucan family phosphorylase [Microbacteriaceae bacterium]